MKEHEEHFFLPLFLFRILWQRTVTALTALSPALTTCSEWIWYRVPHFQLSLSILQTFFFILNCKFLIILSYRTLHLNKKSWQIRILRCPNLERPVCQALCLFSSRWKEMDISTEKAYQFYWKSLVMVISVLLRWYPFTILHRNSFKSTLPMACKVMEWFLWEKLVINRDLTSTCFVNCLFNLLKVSHLMIFWS